MIYVIATITIKPEKQAELLEAARACIAATLEEEGCLSYDISGSVTQPETYTFVERWESREALGAHGRTDHSRSGARRAQRPFFREKLKYFPTLLSRQRNQNFTDETA